MRLRLVRVLGPAHGEKRSLRESVVHERHRVGDRERVAVEEHQQIVVVGLRSDLDREVVELRCVHPFLRNDAVEMRRVGRVDSLERSPHAVRNADVLADVARLNLDPARRTVVNRRYVKHRMGSCATRRWRCGVRE